MIATKTKAIVSMMLVGFIVFAVLFWLGMPKTLFDDSGLRAFSSITICMFLVHLGTTIKIRDFIKEWKTVVLVAASTAAMALGVYFIGKFLMDQYYALVGGPCLAGGMVAFMVMQKVGDTLGRVDVNVFALLVLSFQGFIGIPIASNLGTREGRDLLQRWKDGTYVPQLSAAENSESTGGCSGLRKFLTLPEKYNGPNVILFKVAIIAFLAERLSTVTPIHMLILSLIFGVIFHEIGFLDDGALQKANGFPGTFLISQEISNAVGTNDEEKKIVLDYLMPKLVIGGIVSVSVVSGLVAGVMCEWI